MKKAQSFLRVSAYSRQGLIEILEYSGFPNDEAVYGADNSGADWFEQAAKKAESFLKISAYSRSGLIEIIEYSGFTREQAVYGVEAVGY